jgi:D-alanyl-D-alanine carboxypeptidase (penicillin-binding protein 5/6)
VILQDHPLSAGGPGPDITVQPPEAAADPSQARDGDSLVAVAAGEAISERHALEALLLPSADNMAWILARWDAGGQGAFTAKMNAAARALGMTGTSYTDAAGLDPSTVSTAADQVRLGMAAMGVSALAAIVDMPTAVVPVAGTIRNTNTLLGQDGIAGLKTGSTQAAGGCLLIAPGKRSVGSRHRPFGERLGNYPERTAATPEASPLPLLAARRRPLQMHMHMQMMLTRDNTAISGPMFPLRGGSLTYDTIVYDIS